MDIVVKGRNVEVPDHYRQHVADKLQKVERYDHKLIRVDVELFHERNPRRSDHCQRVEITCVSRGPVIRAEACAADFYSALDAAIAKLDSRLSRAADRRRVHRGRHAPVSLGDYLAGSNHVLPTGGCACHSSGLSVQSFLRGVHVVEYDRDALAEATARVVALAEAEDLPAHGAALKARFDWTIPS